MAQQQAKRKPVYEMRFGTIKAAIWRNDTVAGPMYGTTFERLYKPQDGEWSSSASFGRDDLLLVAKLADRCNTWIYAQEAKDREAAKKRQGASGYADEEGGYEQ